MDVAFLDADVLAQATPRTLLYLASVICEPPFRLVYSALVEAQAERAQRPGARRVSLLRNRWGWELSADHPDPDALGLIDTDPDDKAVLAAAINAGSQYVITGNVRHFGWHDLAHHAITAVHPGRCLSERLDARTYRVIVKQLAGARTQPPNTPIDIHVMQVSDELPDLFEKFIDIFGPAQSARTKGPLRETIRAPIKRVR